jgi:T-complex protein 1 subunit gamma
MTQLRAEHAEGKTQIGVDGNKGVITNMDELKVWEPYLVKSQTYKTAIEVCAWADESIHLLFEC